ncbi:MAG: hypothetical protein AAB788_04690 [Patescibacteria group bacterium]
MNNSPISPKRREEISAPGFSFSEDIAKHNIVEQSYRKKIKNLVRFAIVSALTLTGGGVALLYFAR